MSQSVPSSIPSTWMPASTATNVLKPWVSWAIDFNMEDIVTEEDIGAIVVATGFSHFDPTPMTEYGYGRFRMSSPPWKWNVSTILGPTRGSLIRPSDNVN